MKLPSPTQRPLLRRSLFGIAAIAVAAVVGVGLGVGISELSDDDAREPGAVVSPSDETAAAVRVEIVSARLKLAVTARGRRRDRARLSVHVRVTNTGGTRIEFTDPVLVSGRRVRPDPLASDTTGSLLKPIDSGATAGGRLRFETGGAVTRDLVRTRRAQLSIAGTTVPMQIALERPPE